MKYKLIIKLLITSLLITIILLSVNIDEFISVLKNTHLYLFLLASSLSIPGILISTFKWKILLDAHGIRHIPFPYLWGLYHIGMFFSNFLPTEVGGDIVRSYVVGKRSGKKTEAFAGVIMERLTGLIAIVLIAFIGCTLNFTLLNKLDLLQPFLVIIAASGLLLILFVNYRWLANALRRYFSINMLNVVSRKIDVLYDAITFYKRKRPVLCVAMIISLIFQMLTIMYVYILLASLGLSVSFLHLILIVPLITILGLVPITINSIGLREGAFIYLFFQFGLSTSESFALSINYRLGILIFSLIGGLVYTFSEVKYDGLVEKLKSDGKVKSSKFKARTFSKAVRRNHVE